jgi:hypothetical protein
MEQPEIAKGLQVEMQGEDVQDSLSQDWAEIRRINESRQVHNETEMA